MNLSDTSGVVTILLGTITILTWLLKLLSWFRKRHIQIKNRAKEWNQFSKLVLNSATNPSKRADIYFFMTLRAIEFKSRQIKFTVQLISMGFMIFILFLIDYFIFKFYAFDYSHPVIIIQIFLFIGILLSYCMLFWYSSGLRRVERSWEEGSLDTISEIIKQHFPDD
jgi:hypothetical protein